MALQNRSGNFSQIPSWNFIARVRGKGAGSIVGVSIVLILSFFQCKKARELPLFGPWLNHQASLRITTELTLL